MSRWWSFAAVTALLGCSGPNALDAWPAALRVQSPAAQTGLTGAPVNEPPAVRLVDVDGNGIPGANVTFTVTGGGGSVTGGVATTGSDGVATVGSWSIGAGTNRLTASIPAPFRVDSVQFGATGVAQSYHIDLSYLTPISPSRQAVFSNAAARWEFAIIGDVTDLTVSIPAGSCFGNEPPINQTIDDLLILVTLDSIDGPNGILGAAAPCFIRTAGKVPLIGVMIFDTADVAALEAAGQFDEVILHEMGHVLGYGTVWSLLGLLAGPASSGGTDPHFIGVKALAAFDRIGGTAYTGGLKVPVENLFGPGTADSHWRESVFGNELMTGFLNSAVANPLSVVTIAAMGDQGYLVNYSAADPYVHTFSAAPAPLPGAPAAPAAGTISLGNDILRLPLYTVDLTGRVTRVVRP